MNGLINQAFLIIVTIMLIIVTVHGEAKKSKNVNSYKLSLIAIIIHNIFLIISYYDNGQLYFIGVGKSISVCSLFIFRNIFVEFTSKFDIRSKNSIKGSLISILPFILAFVMGVDFIRVIINEELVTASIDDFNLIIVLIVVAYQLVVVGLLIAENIKMYKASIARFKQLYFSNILINSLYGVLIISVFLSGQLEMQIQMSGIVYIIYIFSLIFHNPRDEYLPQNQLRIQDENDQVDKKPLKVQERRTLDSLTGLYKRDYFIKHLSIMDVNDDSLTVVVISITGLKLINESFGYDIGDEILQDLSVIISEVFQESMISRISGSRFAILQFGISEEAINERIQTVKNTCVERDGFIVNFHFGYYMRRTASLSPYDVFKRAEEVLYYNKLMDNHNNQKKIADMLYQNFGKILPSLSGHLKRSMELAEGFCEFLQLSNTVKTDIVNGALIHDIALTFVPTIIEYNIEFKDSFEKQIYKTHVSKGYDISVESGMNPMVSKGILHHHENYNGSGYPMGLIGEEIPIESQIIALVDFVDMVMHFGKKSSKLEDILLSKVNVEFSKELVYNMIGYLKSKNIIKG